MMMNSIGLPGLLLVMVIFLTLVIVPFWKLLPKFGYSKWIALLIFIPFVPLILLWMMALTEPEARSAT